MGVSHDTYEKGAAFAEGQGPDWSSRVRELHCCKKNEIDTAPKPRAHNRRVEKRDAGSGLRGQSYCEITRSEFRRETPEFATLSSSNHYDRSYNVSREPLRGGFPFLPFSTSAFALVPTVSLPIMRSAVSVNSTRYAGRLIPTERNCKSYSCSKYRRSAHAFMRPESTD